MKTQERKGTRKEDYPPKTKFYVAPDAFVTNVLNSDQGRGGRVDQLILFQKYYRKLRRTERLAHREEPHR